jgi:hypothetical protein
MRFGISYSVVLKDGVKQNLLFRNFYNPSSSILRRLNIHNMR